MFANLRLSPAAATLVLIAALTATRVLALFTTQLELHPDEAQYWLWSRELAFGYYSKPPMIAWLIAATTAIGGDAEPWVRLSAPFLHAGAAVALFWAGRSLYSPWTGFWAATLYAIMPGVQLSSAVIATDAPLLLCLSLALLAYVIKLREGGVRAALALGLALGAAALSKYAAVYFILGLVLHAVISRETRASWRPVHLAAAGGAFAAVLAPNLIWNAVNGFQTVAHTAANSSWGETERFQLASLLEFWGEQFGVFGPIPLLVLIVGSVLLALRRRLTPQDRMLLCLTLPPLLIISGQAFLTRANANWAAAAYVPASVLVAAWLVRWRSRWGLGSATVSQSVLMAVGIAAATSPAFATAVGLDNAFKRTRGWRATTQAVLARAETEPGLTAIAVDDRFVYNALAYYGRARWAADGPPLVIWVREASPQNQAESTDPLTPALGERVLAVSEVEDYRGEMRRDFAVARAAVDLSVRLDAKRTRDLQLFVGEGFAPQPRDPRTGLPISGSRAP